MNSKINQLFRQGSRTYYNATRFFPKNIREEVFRLYAFVRQADNYIDNIPADLVGWQGFLAEFREARNGKKVGDVVIKEFIKLARTIADLAQKENIEESHLMEALQYSCLLYTSPSPRD